MRLPTLPRWLRIAVPSLAAGAGITLSLPPFGFWVLAFAGAALLWWRLGELSWSERFAAGWLAGLGQFVPGLWWSLSFNVYGGLVMMVVEALAPAIACAAVPSRRGRTFALAGGMVLTEALRATWPFGGLPLASTALGQAGGPLADAARLGGPYLLIAMVWLAGGGIGLLLSTWTELMRSFFSGRARWRPSRPSGASSSRLGEPSRRRRAAVVASASALLAMGAVAGLAGWGTVAASGGRPVSKLRVVAVQGGGTRGLRKSQVNPATVFRAQVGATAAVSKTGRTDPPRLIVWPEDVVSLNDLLSRDPLRTQLSSIAKQNHSTLLVGVTETVSNTSYRNEIVAFSPDGRVVAHYEKVHRVPFGEYVPFRGLFRHLADLSAVPLDAIPGHGDGLLPTPSGPLGVMVSYEVFFAERGWLPTRAGAELLIVPTNTSSYATSQVPTQEIAAARLQAISEGRYLVQAAPTGYSAIIDNKGRVLSRSVLGAREALAGRVSLLRQRTFYGRAGDLPVLVGAAVFLVIAWAVSLATDRSSDSTRIERWGRTTRIKRWNRFARAQALRSASDHS